LSSVENERHQLDTRLRNTQLELSKVKGQHRSEMQAAESRWMKKFEDLDHARSESESQLQGDVEKLEKMVEELETELSRERKVHRESRTALDHMLIHFASLPTSNSGSGHRCNDELVTWTQ